MQAKTFKEIKEWITKVTDVDVRLLVSELGPSPKKTHRTKGETVATTVFFEREIEL